MIIFNFLVTSTCKMEKVEDNNKKIKKRKQFGENTKQIYEYSKAVANITLAEELAVALNKKEKYFTSSLVVKLKFISFGPQCWEAIYLRMLQSKRFGSNKESTSKLMSILRQKTNRFTRINVS